MALPHFVSSRGTRLSLTACAVGGFVLGIVLGGGMRAGERVERARTRWTRIESFSGAGGPGFTEMDPTATGIWFTNTLSQTRSLTNQVFLNGSGVAAADVDGDGWCDLYFCGLDVSNRLYRNRGGWHFEDITAAAGVGCADAASTGAVFVDVDGDGDADLLVNGINRGTRLFLNDGGARFREVTGEFGLRGGSGASSLALADVDGDGWLDLYVVNYRTDTMRDMPDLDFQVGASNGVYRVLSVNGRPADSPDLVGRFAIDRGTGVLENGEADVFYRNRGGRRMEVVPWSAGVFLDERGQPVSVPYDWGLSAMFRDLDGDGWPDLYVCNDFQSPDRIWMNDGRGHLRAIARDALRQTSLFSMGVDVADVDRDGRPDIFVVDMLGRRFAERQVQVLDPAAFAQIRDGQGDRPQFSRNTLFHRRDDGTYGEIAQFSGVDASDWSWCPAFVDVDLDGFEDLLITTGHGRDAMNADLARELEGEKDRRRLGRAAQLALRSKYPPLHVPNVAFRNRGDLTFEEVGAAWGFDSRRICHGMALADLDRDGDPDVVLSVLNDLPVLCRNNASRARLGVRLRGRAPNTGGVGARITVKTPSLPVQTQEMTCGGRYLSGDELLRCFAAGSVTNLLDVEVVWRSGRRSRSGAVPANSIVEIEEAGADEIGPGDTTDARLRPVPWFEEVSDLLAHRHQDRLPEELASQPLLPRRVASYGPGVTWFDFNGDGWEDLIIGAGAGGRLGVYRNNGSGGFVPQRAALLEKATDRVWASVMGWWPTGAAPELALGLGRIEAADGEAAVLRRIALTTGVIDDTAASTRGETGPLAAADYDGDGDLDMVAGIRWVPGRYPEPGPSLLLRNDGGRLVPDPVAGAPLRTAGLANAVCWSDLDGDGRPELVLACDWGPLRILRFEKGVFVPSEFDVLTVDGSGQVRARLPLETRTGWWNSVATGDFDNDGRLDLVAGNWGRNSARQRFLDRPLKLWWTSHPNYRGRGLIEAVVDPERGDWVPLRDRGALAGAFPFIGEAFPSHRAFSRATLEQVFDAGLPPMEALEAVTFDSVVLLNRGGAFELRSLPREAQMAPVFGIGVGDLDGDGNEDVFVAQNFFGVTSFESRLDGGSGVWLRGHGDGTFQAVGPGEAGISIHGEGRGVALADFDHDGRLDLVVGQYRGATRLFHNDRAVPGLRLEVRGRGSNPWGVGALARLVYRNGRRGPVHEIRAGGGYASQDGPGMILGMASEPSAVWIRWPGGREETIPLAPGLTRVVATDR